MTCVVSGCVLHPNPYSKACHFHMCCHHKCEEPAKFKNKKPHLNIYCSKHVCTEENCLRVVHKDGKCRNHSPDVICKYEGCQNLLTGKFNYCSNHRCCDILCNEPIMEGKSWCSKHACHAGNCQRNSLLNSNYCQYDKCSKYCCNEPRYGDSRGCIEHKCIAAGCKHTSMDTFNVCSVHKCNTTACNNICERTESFCHHHRCCYDDCNDEVYLDGQCQHHYRTTIPYLTHYNNPIADISDDSYPLITDVTETILDLTLDEDSSEDVPDEIKCKICLDATSLDDRYKTSCLHGPYHQGCINRWLNHNANILKNCPECRNVRTTIFNVGNG